MQAATLVEIGLAGQLRSDCGEQPHSREIIAICAAGPPQASAPKLRNRMNSDSGRSRCAVVCSSLEARHSHRMHAIAGSG